jgi:hypothetical protein
MQTGTELEAERITPLGCNFHELLIMSIQVVFGYDMAFLSCLEFFPDATRTELIN